ncbi:hypothetical protein [Micromonospora sp. NPDC023633]|uniref:hypothetical protein n=1 Tax=Micromonospora sp. NPDC023633 TaxID=3154320 RepID=UPI0033DA4527
MILSTPSSNVNIDGRCRRGPPDCNAVPVIDAPVIPAARPKWISRLTREGRRS